MTEPYIVAEVNQDSLNKVLVTLSVLGRNDVFSEELLNEIGEYIKFKIKERTLEGRDVSGNAFTPYSDAYKAYREIHGRPTAWVDLFFTGSMQGSMTHEVDGNSGEVKVFFMNTQDKSGASNPEKAFYLNEERNFFGVSEEEIEEIRDIVQEYIEDLIENGNLR